ncbi:hypothetical protein SAMN05444359_101391 [Neolewinella agarilytica]|uniref:Uncharacterized protein n=1 Tax=Neolewinella agarilytica TaxID=478744 RepID=A0A1H8ZP43_9BACT|nr:hypothetical protein SAMN05444359_101391 [Neolewinella agarilytica]
MARANSPHTSVNSFPEGTRHRSLPEAASTGKLVAQRPPPTPLLLPLLRKIRSRSGQGQQPAYLSQLLPGENSPPLAARGSINRKTRRAATSSRSSSPPAPQENKVAQRPGPTAAYLSQLLPEGNSPPLAAGGSINWKTRRAATSSHSSSPPAPQENKVAQRPGPTAAYLSQLLPEGNSPPLAAGGSINRKTRHAANR